MKKIALITFCNHELKVNYGQVLQVYALYSYLVSCGHMVKVINYRAPFANESGLYFNLIGKTFYYQERYKKKKEKEHYTNRNRKFYDFMRQMTNITRPCYTEADVMKELEDCDVFMAGSDQVWNIEAFDKIRLLGVDKEIKRVSYASSGLFVEDMKLDDIYLKMSKHWAKIDNISVREESGKKIICKYIDKPVEVVVDPVFLLEEKQWNIENRTVKEPYVLCYFLGGSRPHAHIIRHISRKLGINKIVFIDARNYENYKGIGDIKRDVGPIEFVELISHAEMVCTDSFHGAMFSIIFKRQFYLMKRTRKHKSTFSSVERFRMMFEQWGLKERMIKNIKEYDEIADINYDVVYDEINKHIDKSKNYLNKVLGEENVSKKEEGRN